MEKIAPKGNFRLRVRGVDALVHWTKYAFSPAHALPYLSAGLHRTRGWLPLFWAVGLYAALVLAPMDYQQKDAFRIIYVHVPAAFLSLFIYVWAAGFALLHWVFRLKIAEWVSLMSAYGGSLATALALCTGAIWGKPMWGAWWVWDARLTSELVLLLLYLGYILLYHAIADKNRRGRVAGMLLIVGVVNIPIIHYSVYWWQTLHQGATLNTWGESRMHADMLYPLLWMLLVGFLTFFRQLCYALTLCIRQEKIRASRIASGESSV